ncbi:hypothetical protein [Pseudarthrobacter albicanus]|uniref:hypothetical protein n=1 Tax=Pseudarthrobacter albicanus TaxID=2823873 RepID=UPI001BA944F8|nr:hypothetical protein [Pseudarthrobacter albicanus]
MDKDLHLGGAPYDTLQTVNVMLLTGRIWLVVAASVGLGQTLARHDAAGVTDGDVLKGPALVILTATMMAVLAGGAFLLLKSGQRWACWLDALVWPVVWFLAVYLGGFGYAIPGLACALGIFLTVATYFLMPSRESDNRWRSKRAG